VVARLLGEEEKKGYLMEVLFALLEQKEKLRWIVVGVFVNVSAAERGRRFLVEEGMGVRFVQYINSFD
jgi:RecB family endonuclease NucS